MADNSKTIILLGGLGVAAYGYYAGWFNSILASLGIALPAGTAGAVTSTLPAISPQLSAQQAANMVAAEQLAAATITPQAQPAPGTTTVVTAPPPLGTTVTTAAQASAQAGANDPYIIPGVALANSSPPAGYQLFNTADYGNIWARNDVVTAATNWLLTQQASVGAACSAFALQAPSLPCPTSVPTMTLAQLQTIMSTAGLTGFTPRGLGDFQRHMFSRTGRYRPARVA